ncbi:MAG: hypothetical protein DBX39_06685 [Bacillota bacterium]|nr:MAG: hypothetical protein DBX39_06685 [Bacillota bacterium]
MDKLKMKRLFLKIAGYFILICFSAFFMFLFFFMLFKSFMANAESYGNPAIRFFPSEWHFENYVKVFDEQFIRYFGNTLIVLVFNLIGVPFFSSLCAFGFSRCKFHGRDIWFGITLATMMLPAVVVQVPLYVLFKLLGMTGNLLPLIIPPMFGGGATNIFLTRQFMKGLPKELDEAASLDGANIFKIYFNIILPLCLPIIVFVVIGTFTAVWNDFTSALLYVTNEKYYTLALGVYFKFMVSGSTVVFPNVKMATGVVMVIPVAVLFLIFQKQLIEGVATTGMKN